jgi:hypothetical protein
MNLLLLAFSVAVVAFLVRCIYLNLDIPEEEKKEEKKDEQKPPPTLEETLTLILQKLKNHTTEVKVSTDMVEVYCFKKSPEDSISDFNVIKIRFCDLDFKTISVDDCEELQTHLEKALGLNAPETIPTEDS